MTIAEPSRFNYSKLSDAELLKIHKIGAKGPSNSALMEWLNRRKAERFAAWKTKLKQRSKRVKRLKKATILERNQ